MADIPGFGGGVQNLSNLVQVIQAGNQSLVKEMIELIATLAGQGPVLPLSGYAEGTWTPGVTFGGAGVGLTYGSQIGTFTHIGRMVFCQFHLVLTAKGTSTGAAVLTGLPVAANASGASAGSGGTLTNYSNFTGLVGVPALHGSASASTMALVQFGAAAAVAVTDAAFTDTASLDGSFAFFV